MSDSVGCYCRRTVEEAHAEMAAGAEPTCVTCGQRPAEDTQCRTCREERQRRAAEEFAAWWARLRCGAARHRPP
ncbi:hypothetical protein [Frankia sp. AgB32]|uniref:hypothetical protein n=1 Tax=Frankia sp. AgB32 TaxID=631119 RepID=UPI00200EF78C|nr:hypothetical protein [Frankia sp. AgB32]MCK9894389.1 hypothetical protein [Frankia sp. AgB32]